MMARRGALPYIRLIPQIADEQLAILYRNARALIYASFAEGFGIPLIEAMACGCPVIASDIDAFREIARGAALFFEPSKPNMLAEAMNAVDNAKVRSEFISRGTARGKEFDWNESAAQHVALYHQLAYES